MPKVLNFKNKVNIYMYFSKKGKCIYIYIYFNFDQIKSIYLHPGWKPDWGHMDGLVHIKKPREKDRTEDVIVGRPKNVKYPR